MPSFYFQALDPNGQIVAGLERAVSRGEALASLEARSLLPLLVETEAVAAVGEPVAIRRLSEDRITALIEDLALLLASGVGLDRSLVVMAETAGGPALELIRALHRSIAEGMSFAEAVACHPRHFSRIFVEVAVVAEAAGTLDAALTMVARDRRRSREMKRRLGAALAYPAFLAVAALAVLLFVLVFIIPRFREAVEGFGDAAGTGQAALAFALSDMVRANLDVVGLAVVACLVALVALWRNGQARAVLFDLLARLPGLSGIVAHERTVAIASMLGMLAANGVDLPTALRRIAAMLRESGARERMADVMAEVRAGRRLTDAMAASGLMPLYALQILRIGEETGEFAPAAARVARIYQARLDRDLARLTAIAAPVVLLLVSALIAWVIVSVTTALIGMNELVL
jgi:general secretion pathway protein F